MQGFFKINPCGDICKLSLTCSSPCMPVTGKGRMKILVIAEAPGQQEDEQNTQLIGAAGRVLREALAKVGVDLDKDCRKTNAIRCRPPKNRKPTRVEIKACNPHIWEEVERFQPKLILLLGQTALDSFLLDRFEKSPGSISRWRGFAIPDRKTNAWVMATWHPSYILRTQNMYHGNSEEAKFFLKDIEKGLEHRKQAFPFLPEPKIQIGGIFPSWIGRSKVLAFDYETNGIRPWKVPGARIVSFACCSKEKVYATSTIANFWEWKKILANLAIKKVAHNMKFEHEWSRHCLGVETQSWLWDSMIAAHLIDNRKQVTGLKFQAYISLGVEDWSKGVEGIGSEKATKESLHYNALDSFYTYWLWRYQKRLMFNDTDTK